MKHDWDLQNFIEQAEENIREQTKGLCIHAREWWSGQHRGLCSPGEAGSRVYGLFVESCDDEREQVEEAPCRGHSEPSRLRGQCRIL